MLRAALLHLDELAEIRQSRFHLRVGGAKRRSLHGTLEKLASKSSVDRQARIAAKSGVLLTALIVGGGLARRAAATRLRRGNDAAGGVVRNTGRGEISEKCLDAAESRLDLVDLALTEVVSVSRSQHSGGNILLRRDENTLTGFFRALTSAGRGTRTLGRSAVGARPVLVTADLGNSLLAESVTMESSG